MTGYQEVLTDPSYRGQIVTMTYPEIGNYGVNPTDVESAKPQLAGFVVRERSRRASNFRADGELHEYLVGYGIVGLEGIDTRALVRRIRIRGAMKGVLSTEDLDDARLVAKAQGQPGPGGPRPGARSDAGGGREWHKSLSPGLSRDLTGPRRATGRRCRPHVVALDYGMKWNIARHLYEWAAA